MTEPRNPDLTIQDEIDLELLGGGTEEEPTKRTLLEVWLEILSNIEEVAKERISPAHAQRLVSTWPKMDYSDLSTYNEFYYGFLTELRQALAEYVDENQSALKNVDHDAVDNHDHYTEILFLWNSTVARFEHEWEADAPDAAAWIAAIADATAFFIGPNGLVNHLDSIQFQYTEADRQSLADRLTEYRSELS